jgi:hypothetical protein
MCDSATLVDMELLLVQSCILHYFQLLYLSDLYTKIFSILNAVDQLTGL